MLKRLLFLFLCLTCCLSFTKAQVVINEIQSSNSSGIQDEDNENSDWIELYNSSDEDINLTGYILNDKRIDSSGWVFPDVIIPSKSFLLVFASGKDRNIVGSKYHTIIRRGDTWKYFIPAQGMPENWRNPDFNDSLWASGPSGFGYTDNDDSTFLNNVKTLLIRKEFDVEDLNSVTGMLLHVDYDDGFIAFINGVQVAMGAITSFNEDYSVVEAGYHEAVLYSGGIPDQFNLKDKISLLRKGKNVIAIQGHNNGTSSSDFSLIPFLTLSNTYFTNNDVERFITSEIKNLHTNFKISKEGESIYLFNAASELIDSSKALAVDDDTSFGRFEDGDSSWFYFNQPSPGFKNADPVEILSDDSVLFNAQSGFYAQPFNLAMKLSSGDGVIHYTTDGSVPTAQSAIYSDSIAISNTTVVRAAFFNDTVAKYPVTTKTFIFNTHNDLPVVSISSDPKHFFDWNEGIFVMGPNAELANPYFGANFWQDWEKPVNFEFFDKNGVIKINQGAGVKVFGNWSRANAQKSVALFARKEYGKGSFKYKFFNDRENDSFESVILRNSGNDWGNSFMRDGLNSEIAKNMDMERMAYQPMVVYLNGVYWGILEMREKINENYFKENFGIDEENLNLLENESSVVFGSRTSYSKLLSVLNSKAILNAANYAQINNLVDIDCYFDYELLQIYISNNDWPGNNIKYWNSNDPLVKWRWVLFDTDASYELWGSTGNTMAYAAAANGPGYPNPPWSTVLLRKLLVNNDFKNQFVNRFSDCMNTNLQASSIIQKVDSIQNILEPEIQHHLTRWSNDYNYWKSAVQKIRNWASNRNSYMRSYIQNYFKFNHDNVITLSVSDNNAGRIKINTIIPNSYPFKGNYFGEVPITLKAIPNPGYRFVRWEDGSTSTNVTIAANLTASMKFHAVFEPVSANDFRIVINEINYNSGDEYDTDDWIEIYNNGDQTVDLTGWIIQDGNAENHFTFPAGHILYPEEYCVITNNISKFRSVYPSVTNSVGDFIFGLSSGGDIVYLYDNEGDMIDKVNFGAQSPWPASPNGTGSTLELKAPSLNNEQAGNWSAGKLGGTPGYQNSVVVSNRVLNEEEQQISCFPTSFSDYTTLSFYSPGKGDYSVQIIDMQGRVVETVSGLNLSVGMNYLDLFKESGRFHSGFYFVKVQTINGVQTVKVIKK